MPSKVYKAPNTSSSSSIADLLSPRMSSNGSTKSESSGKVVCRSGIGGRGNYRKVDAAEVPSMPSSYALPPRTQRLYSSGIGGAGNHHQSNDKSLIDMEDKMERQRVFKSRPKNRHYGIGGFGNFANSRQPESSSSSQTRASSYSSEALPYGALDSFGRKLSRTFKKRKGVSSISSST